MNFIKSNCIPLFRVRIIITSALILLSLKSVAQGPQQQPMSGIPNVTPPSPTVAGIMKFEEVPVDNYTGIPDISMPLANMATHSKDISVDLSLSYHPSSIAIDQEASFVGLGWSLNAGGIVSRTVRGIPDEAFGSAWGIHNSANPYYDVIQVIGNSGADANNIIHFNEFLYDTNEKGLYDTEHDLYQYNFFGHTGRFIITKVCDQVGQDNCFQIERLDYNDIVDIKYYNSGKYFIFYDDKGNNFKFNVTEITSGGTGTGTEKYQTAGTFTSSGDPYISAFHLSEIRDRNNALIVTYLYSSLIINEPLNSSSYTSVQIPTAGGYPVEAAAIAQCSTTTPGDWLEPTGIHTFNNQSVSTKKIQTIVVADVGQINFTFKPRTDFQTSGYCLDGMTVTNNKNQVIKNLKFDYDYSKIRKGANEEKKRLMLTKLSEITTNETLSSEFYYADRIDSLSVAIKDYWGFLTYTPEYEATYGFRETNPDYVVTYALQKIKLPTGGAKIFDWGSNTYSYIGNTQLNDFSENPFNWYSFTENILGTGNSNNGGISKIFLHYSEYDQKFKKYDCTPSQQSHCNDGNLMIWLGPNQYEPVTDWNPNEDYILQGGVQYAMVFQCSYNSGGGGISDNGNGGPVNGSTMCKGIYFTRKTPELKYLYGGGIRIDKIGYFENGEVPKQYYEEYKDDVSIHQFYKPAKEKNYDYRTFSDNLRSSGSLVFAKPRFERGYEKTYQFYCMSADTGLPIMYFYKSVPYLATTDFNQYSPVRTKGSDVGYQNVLVNETGNGFSKFIYKSPIDHPEESYVFSYPFIPTPNEDYKRGHLTNEKHFKENGDLLSETIYTYEFAEESKVETGKRVSAARPNAFAYQYPTGAAYVSQISNCNESAPVCDGYYNSWGMPVDYISCDPIREAVGWAQLKGKVTNNYFYDASGQHVVSTNSAFIYNPINRKIYSQMDVLGDETIYKTYTYTSLPNNHIGDVVSVKTINNSVVINCEYIDYGQSGTSNGLPLKFRKSKTDVVSTDAEVMQEVYSYDNFGNILKMSSGPGMGGYKTIVWGYFDTLPIAIIEGGSTFNDIMNDPTIVGLINTAKVSSNLGSETQLITALNNLRNGLPNKMVTTFIHKPLVGITQSTDPKGLRTSYEYDDFNRLKLVKDADGNILSQNEYHYKPAN